jgi:hypothetical protein
MVVSATLRPSAELLPQVQRLEKPQVPLPAFFVSVDVLILKVLKVVYFHTLS